MFSKNKANCFNSEYDSVIEANFFNQAMDSFRCYPKGDKPFPKSNEVVDGT